MQKRRKDYKMKPKQLIIIGEGTSIKEGISKGLWEKLTNRFTISMNFNYRFCDSTILTFVDPEFRNGYTKEEHKRHKWKGTKQELLDHIKILDSLPLLIGQNPEEVLKHYGNTILFHSSAEYHGRDSIKNDMIFRPNLCGVFSLTLGVCLLDVGEIFLLGYDAGGVGLFEKDQPHTHFYQGTGFKHRGMGNTHYYDDNHEERDYGVFKNDPKIKIYNVSLDSKIPDHIFPKVSYNEFFGLLDAKKYPQDVLRASVRNEIYKQRTQLQNK